MKSLNKFLNIAQNKYFLVIAFFVVWMAFFDPRDWSLIYERRQKLQELEKSQNHMTAEITSTRKELHSLKTSALTIEKYAREKYLMKKDNEDLFIVKTP
jgi:cell division protein FtsB